MLRSIAQFAATLALAFLLSLTSSAQAQSLGCTILTHNLSFGSRGADVLSLQQFLNAQDSTFASSNLTGFFGPLTQGAVMRWQAAHGIVSSGTPATTGWGVVGPRTRVAIMAVCGASAANANPPPTSSTGGSVGVGTNATTPPVSSAASEQPLIGAIRWDAWWPGAFDALGKNVLLTDSFYADYSYREPTYGWYDADVSNAQAIMDQEILDAANHGIDFWAFDNYWPLTQLSPLQGEAPMYDAFKEYLASPNKARLKFAFILSPGAMAYGDGGDPTIGFWDTYQPYLISMFEDPQYLKVDGNRPVVFLGSTINGLVAQWGQNGYGNWSTIEQAFDKKVEAAGLGNPIFVDTAGDLTGANAGVEGVTTYGPMNVAADPPTPNGGHICFSAQTTKDESNWASAAQSGMVVVPGLSPVEDPRPLPGYGYYVDQPTYTQWQQELEDAFTFMSNNTAHETNPPIALVDAWNELGEEGPGIVPTKQNGTMFLDAIEAVKTGDFPSTYQDTYNGDNCMIQLTGNWTDYGPVPGAPLQGGPSPIQGNFNNDEEISQGIGDTAILTADNITQFTIHGAMGPNRGVMQVYIDGVSQGTVTLTNTNWSEGVIFQSKPLTTGTHTLKIVNASTNTSASQVGIDYIVASHGSATPPPPPTISFTAAPTSGNAPLTVRFTVSGAEGTDIGQAIAFGDGTPVSTFSASPVCNDNGAGCNEQATVSHTYGQGGTFAAQLLDHYPQTTMCPVSEENCNALASATVTVSSPVPPAPTVTFTVNGQTNITTSVGDQSTYQWSSINASTATGTYTEDGGAPQPWTGHPDTLNGSQTDTAAAWEAGHTFVITYTVSNTQGQTASASVEVYVAPSNVAQPGGQCGGSTVNAPSCPSGYYCDMNGYPPDTGGICEPNPAG